ncbi:immunoglobulin-like domain-containing protein [Pseudoalteromonas spongiae]|uniref:immunoglobulin-like domain-containing protein n=1 Tax=Pseudoalteromonas spongiae TaxID=298657 RepID=UPI0037350A21
MSYLKIISFLFLTLSILTGCGGSDKKDTTPPVISVLGDNPLSVEFGSEYTDSGATAHDAVDGAVVVTSSGEVNTSKIGEYRITYSAQDKSGNTSLAERSVVVVDTTPPVITLVGKGVVTTEYASQYVELGVKAHDAVDGQIEVEISGIVDTQKLDEYTIVYSAVDSSGNASSIERKVIVADSLSPLITLNGESEVTLEYGHEYVESGAIAVDNYDGEIIPSISGYVNNLKQGEYKVEYRANDSSGNSSISHRTVYVVDTTPPTIDVLGSNPITIEYGTQYIDEGAVGSDIIDGDLYVSVSGIININKVGEYFIEYATEDNSGLKATATRTIFVVDKKPPEITLNGKTPLMVAQGSNFEDPGASANDEVDGLVEVEVSHNVNSNEVGEYLVTYVATDKSGNVSQKERLVIVDVGIADVVSDFNLLQCLNESDLIVVSQVEELDCRQKNIVSAAGIEYFQNMKVLNLSVNSLTQIDLSNNPNITELYLNTNQLSYIDLSKNLALSKVNLSYNKLLNLDFSNNTNLTETLATNNLLEQIVTSGSPELQILELSTNNIINVDVTNNKKLRDLNVWGSDLTEIDLSNNAELVSLVLGANNIAQIEITNNVNLEKLDLSSNKLSTLNVSRNAKLKHLSLGTNQIKTIDLQGNTSLEYLNLSMNQLTEVDLSNNHLLTDLSLVLNSIASLDVTHLSKLTYLNIWANNITSIDVSQNTELTSLVLGGNSLLNLDISNNQKLTDLNLFSTGISEVDLSKLILLERLNLSSNNLVSLDLSNNTELRVLEAQQNNLNELDLINNSNLLRLDVLGNELQYIDFAFNSSISYLQAEGNALTNIDVSSFGLLRELYLSGNNLTEIDLSYNSSLSTLTLDDTVECNGDKCALR